jgi:lipoic acid synthetase
MGETRREILGALTDLRGVGVDIVTIGQYLRPNQRAAPVERYVPPAEFASIAAEAEGMGFGAVVAGPLVRSSYDALRAYTESCVS